MNPREQRKNELLQELSRRFQQNAAVMKQIAGRIQTAASHSGDLDRRLNQVNAQLQAAVDKKAPTLAFSQLEYLEFTNAAEFEKFRALPPISDDDLTGLDLDDLCQKLQA